MKTIYLKTVNRFGGKITRAIALTKTHSIYISDDSISFDEVCEDDQEWFTREWKAVESNKEEFDAFYIETVGVLNNLIKEL
jgi:hypothetical protein